MERIKQLPWAWILTILWLIGSQIAALQIAILPALFIFLLALFAPPVLIVSVILIVIPLVFGLASWISVFFKKKWVAIILSTLGLVFSVGAKLLFDSILNSSGIVMP